MSEHWTDRLSEYLDGEMSDAERGALERHLEACEACARTLSELRAVAARAAALEDRPPAGDLWPLIATEIGAPAAAASDVVELASRRKPWARRVSLSVPQLLAAGIVLVLLSAGSVLWLRPDLRAPSPTLAGDSTAPGGTPGAGVLVDTRTRGYDAAVADLERVLSERREALDPRTVQVLEENLRIIDRAIERSRQALDADPTNPYLNQHLADTKQRKLELLRRATTIATAAS